jgi:hypothetical protein
LNTMAAAIRFTVVWLVTAGKLRKIGKKTKEYPRSDYFRLPPPSA